MINFVDIMVPTVDSNHRKIPYGVWQGFHFTGAMLIPWNHCVLRKRWLLVACLYAVLCTFNLPTSSALTRTLKTFPSNASRRVCQSIDIRNSVSMFDEMHGCEVIEGFLQIVLIDNAEARDFANISFPELREITGYLLLYRVQGLRSLGKLFPNLTVIRGNTLMLNYAFMIFEMLQLQEIGLSSLTDIIRGAVYFAKNPMLCFVDTIDWDKIGPSGKGDHHIIGNKPQEDCPMCPSGLTNTHPCPKHAMTGQPLCWNMHHCQKTCRPECVGNCDEDGACCHKNCLGGCYGPHSDQCFACRHVLSGNQCIEKCSNDTFMYLGRRCISDEECYRMPKPMEITDHNVRSRPYKPFKNLCIIDCPSGFQEKEYSINGTVKYICSDCHGVCKKECNGANIDSIASAQELRGCAIIKGALEIQIKAGNVIKELEDNLNSVEEIEDYLKIVRSYPLLSLNFLPNLKVIHGKKLENGKYSLVVLDNQNLAELWDWKNRTDLRVGGGRLFFHFNPKLCFNKIDTLRQKLGLSDHNDLEIARNSNGDKTACIVEKLNVSVYSKTSKAALIKWKQFENHDSRTLLGYVVYLIEAPFRNITIYDGRDACGGDGWRVDDVSLGDYEKPTEINHVLTMLKPYTQYALYVKTYTIASETRGAQSPIEYFRTNPFTPSEPQSISIYSNSSSELVLHWQPPSQPNGNVTHYVVVALLERDSEEYSLKNRNYCLEPVNFDSRTSRVYAKNTIDTPVERQDVDQESDSCPCNRKQFDSKQQREKEIKFEDHLQNVIYVKRTKRSVSSSAQNTWMDNYEESENLSNVEVAGMYEKFRVVVYGTSYVLKKLKHYSLYNVAVRACREWEEEEDEPRVNNCSKQKITADRTLPLEQADDIDSQSLAWEVSNVTRGMVKLKWEEPPNPNSVIVTYQVEYWRNDIENYKPIIECISRSQFKNTGGSYVLKKLNPGNYSFRVRATSMFGNGKFTIVKNFFILDDAVSLTLVAAAIVGIVLIIFILVFVGAIVYVKRQFGKIPNVKLIAEVNPEYVPSVYVPDDWEVPRENVDLVREIGQGTFGMVYEGTLRGSNPDVRRCAVKTVNANATERERVDFLNEASVMKAFNTHHVVKLLGVVSQGQPTLVIMELMAKGDLKTYLRCCRPDVSTNPNMKPPTLRATLRMALEIADGMAYLAAKKFVHRDLAARNCMVADDLTVKIGDFGMTRDIYETEYYRKGSKGLLPVRWMAPESLKDGVFSSRSDVWSYGVVLYEMATLASQPYQGLSNDQVLKYVKDGGVMEKPENCPETLYTVMRMCWRQKAQNRPTFLALVAMLHENATLEFIDNSFYDSDDGHTLRAAADENTPLAPQCLDNFSLSDTDTPPNGYAHRSGTPVEDDDEDDDEDDTNDYIDSQLHQSPSSHSHGRQPPNGHAPNLVQTTQC